MNLKERLLHKIATISRKKKLYKLDSLFRTLHNPEKRKYNSLVCVLDLDDHFININTNSYLEWYLFFYGDYEPTIKAIIQKIVKPYSICIDIGANIGIHTIRMALTVGQQGKVYAFEPHPVIFNKLQQNLALNNLSWVTTINYAVSNKQGTGILQSFDSNSSNQGTSFIASSDSELSQQTFPIKFTSLNHFIEQENIQRLDLLKIDVEGHEVNVFDGALESIKRFKPAIIFENNKSVPNNTKHLIKELSAECYQFYGIYFNHLRQIHAPQKINELTASNILAVKSRT